MSEFDHSQKIQDLFLTRRELLGRLGNGFAAMGLAGVLSSDASADPKSAIRNPQSLNPLAPRAPHFMPKAKRVIFLFMNCGQARQIRPSMGSWVTYGLGTENQNLPGFIAMCPNGYPIQETQNWQNGFLPGVFQGMYIDPSKDNVEQLIEHIRNRYVVGDE